MQIQIQKNENTTKKSWAPAPHPLAVRINKRWGNCMNKAVI